MKVTQDKVFQPIKLTIESLNELKLITAALNSSNEDLKKQWENMGYNGPVDIDLSFNMWRQLTRMVEDNQ